jgi:hypothetical protein
MSVCLKVMKRLGEVGRRGRPERWRNKTWMLQHDSAQTHKSLLLLESLVKQETSFFPQLPYSTHLNPADLSSVPEVQIQSEI